MNVRLVIGSFPLNLLQCEEIEQVAQDLEALRNGGHLDSITASFHGDTMELTITADGTSATVSMEVE